MTTPPDATADDDKKRAAASRSRTVTARDGLRLHCRDYGDPKSPWTPVLCLPGLSRSARDFADLAGHLAGHRHRPRRVVAVDYRGRGESAWADDPSAYNPFTELDDVYAVTAALDIPHAVVVGVSRGGIVGMFMGTDRPAALAGLVLVDIGPEIEPLGLARIKAYVGRMPPPNDWADAATLLKRLHGGRFTAFDDADWDRFARLTFRDEAGVPVSDYDPRLAETLEGIDFDRPVPDMWKEYRALAGVPLMAIRGENSDLLSEATLAKMADIRPDLVVATVPGAGHAPLLHGGTLLNKVSSFITGLEGQQAPGRPAEGAA